MKTIVCASGVELLMEYLEGSVPPDLRATLESHVAGCPKCMAFIASYRETPRIVREATETTIPPNLAASLKSWLRAQRGARAED